jgi:hypothetical protein
MESGEVVDVRLWDAAFTGERALRIVVEGHATPAAAEQIGNRPRAEPAIEDLDLVWSHERRMRDAARSAQRQLPGEP